MLLHDRSPDRRTHRVRTARIDDAAGLADVWVASWRVAYRGILDDEILEAMSRSKRMAQWLTRLLYVDLGPSRTFVAEGTSGQIVGLCETGPCSDTRGRCGEVFTLYIDPDHWGQGYGAALLAHATHDLRRRGFVEVVLWVLERNQRARAFYEKLGLRWDGQRRVEQLKGRPVSLRYTAPLTARS